MLLEDLAFDIQIPGLVTTKSREWVHEHESLEIVVDRHEAWSSWSDFGLKRKPLSGLTKSPESKKADSADTYEFMERNLIFTRLEIEEICGSPINCHHCKGSSLPGSTWTGYREKKSTLTLISPPRRLHYLYIQIPSKTVCTCSARSIVLNVELHRVSTSRSGCWIFLVPLPNETAISTFGG